MKYIGAEKNYSLCSVLRTHRVGPTDIICLIHADFTDRGGVLLMLTCVNYTTVKTSRGISEETFRLCVEVLIS